MNDAMSATDRSDHVVEYRPDHIDTPRPWRVLKGAGRGLVQGRHLAFRLFLRDVKAEFGQSFLGAFWSFVDPIVLALLFVLLRRRGVLEQPEGTMPFGVYVVFGTLILQAFMNSLRRPLSLLRRSRALITQVAVPPESLLLAELYRSALDACFYVPVLLGTALLTGTWHPAGLVGFVALYPLVFLFGSMLAIPLVPLNAIYNDIERFIGNLSRPLLFLCPTFYWPEAIGPWWVQINAWNPIAVLMMNLRGMAAYGTLPQATGLIVILLFTALLVPIGAYVFRVALPGLGDQIGIPSAWNQDLRSTVSRSASRVSMTGTEADPCATWRGCCGRGAAPKVPAPFTTTSSGRSMISQ